MPVCVCPECSHSHKVPTKNLGLQGRCKACREVFLLVAEPAAEPPPATPPESETFHIPEQFAATAIPTVLIPPPLPQQPAADGWGEVFNNEAPTSTGGVNSGDSSSPSDDEYDFRELEPATSSRKRRGTVDDLPDRPALRAIADVFRVLAYLHFFGAGCVVLFTAFAVVYQIRNQNNARGGMQWMALLGVMVPVAIALIVLGICLLAVREVIAWMLALEARQHEISRNASLR